MIIRQGGNILERREKRREQLLHLQRPNAIKGTVDNRKPRRPKHLFPKKQGKPVGKKEQLIFERFQAIQKENRILLKKMLTIDMKNSDLHPRSFKPPSGPGAYSLNRGQRVENLTSVTQANR